MGLLDLFGFGKKPSLDEWSLDQLKKAGSDLSKPHRIEFLLSFSTQPVAEQAAERMRTAGFEVEVSPSEDRGWVCLATKMMVPDLHTLEKIHRSFDEIVASIGGRYDGWSTAAEE